MIVNPALTANRLDRIIERLDRIQQLADQLSKCPGDLFEQMNIAARLRQEVLGIKAVLIARPYSGSPQLIDQRVV